MSGGKTEQKGDKTDKHHAAIRDELRKKEYPVEDTSMFGYGFPDLVVGVEAKTGNKFVIFEVKSKKGKLSPRQVEFFRRWFGFPVYIIRSLDEALTILKAEAE